MSSPLLASLFATTSVATQQQIPIAPMATAAAAAVTAAAAYSTRFQMIINALLERFTADLGLVQVGPPILCRPQCILAGGIIHRRLLAPFQMLFE
jgi:hypothetical protein